MTIEMLARESRTSTSRAEIGLADRVHSRLFNALYSRSLVYTTSKHHIHGAYPKALWSAIRQVLSPSTLLSKRKFYKNRAFFQGVLSARQDRGAGYKPAP